MKKGIGLYDDIFEDDMMISKDAVMTTLVYALFNIHIASICSRLRESFFLFLE